MTDKRVMVPVEYIKDMENALSFGNPSDIRIARRKLWSCIEAAPEPVSAGPVVFTCHGSSAPAPSGAPAGSDFEDDIPFAQFDRGTVI